MVFDADKCKCLLAIPHSSLKMFPEQFHDTGKSKLMWILSYLMQLLKANDFNVQICMCVYISSHQNVNSSCPWVVGLQVGGLTGISFYIFFCFPTFPLWSYVNAYKVLKGYFSRCWKVVCCTALCRGSPPSVLCSNGVISSQSRICVQRRTMAVSSSVWTCWAPSSASATVATPWRRTGKSVWVSIPSSLA